MAFRDWYKSSAFRISIDVVLCILMILSIETMRDAFGRAWNVVIGAIIMAMGLGAIIAERELTPYLLLVYAAIAAVGCWDLATGLHQYGII
jgi:hypothetical protein